jgi:hypothetical protein
MIIEVDETLFPIVIFKSLPVEISDNDLEEYLSFFEKFLLEASERLVIIHDINKGRFLTGDQLSRIRNWSISKQNLFTEKKIASCVVSSSILSTLIIKAIRFLLKSDFHSEIFSNMDTAISWAQKRLVENKK